MGTQGRKASTLRILVPPGVGERASLGCLWGHRELGLLLSCTPHPPPLPGIAIRVPPWRGSWGAPGVWLLQPRSLMAQRQRQQHKPIAVHLS